MLCSTMLRLYSVYATLGTRQETPAYLQCFVGALPTWCYLPFVFDMPRTEHYHI